MSWENDYVLDLSPEEEARLTERQRRRRLKEQGIPREYLNSNIKGLKSVIESSKQGPLAALPPNVEGIVANYMGFRGKNFPNAWQRFGNNVAAQRELRRLQEEEQELRRLEEIAIIEAAAAAAREEIAREQAERNARLAILKRKQNMNNELARIHRELQPNYIAASKRVNLEEQRRKSRRARGKNHNRYTTQSRQNSSPNAPRTNKRNKTKRGVTHKK